MKLVIYGYCVTQGPERQSTSSAELGDPRARILDSATREFARSGFNGTSLERIAAGAGLSKAGVLHHFAGKAAIPFALLGGRDDAGVRLTEADSTSLDVLESLVTVARRDLQQPLDTRVFAVLAGEALGLESPLRAWFRQRYTDLTAQIAAALDNAVSEGLVRPEVDTAAVAAEALAMMDGLQLQYLLDDDEAAYLGRFTAAIERLIDDIKA